MQNSAEDALEDALCGSGRDGNNGQQAGGENAGRNAQYPAPAAAGHRKPLWLIARRGSAAMLH